MEEKKYELIKFKDGDFSLDVKVAPNEDTVWLTQEEISALFSKAKSTINEHIKNIMKEELNELYVSRKFGKTELSTVKTKPITYYNLDVILSVGYRVNSKRGILFRKWANSILKQYLLNGWIKMEEKKYELIKFKDGDFSLDVSVSPEDNTLRLIQEQIADLYQKSRSTITEHINNIFTEGELVERTSVGISDRTNHRLAKLFNLEVILAVGYRVKSKRGTLFRQWANSILKQFLLNGYAINNQRIMAYQSNILKLETDIINIEKRLKIWYNIFENKYFKYVRW